MPTYDYVCAACGYRTEVVHGIHATGPSHCDRCGGSMRKALSPPTIVFKGSGWAKKDARAARPGGSTGEGGGEAGDASTETARASGDAPTTTKDGGSSDSRTGEAPPGRSSDASTSGKGDASSAAKGRTTGGGPSGSTSPTD